MIETLIEVGIRSGWTPHDVITLLDFTYSLFRAHIINAEMMNEIVTMLWGVMM